MLLDSGREPFVHCHGECIFGFVECLVEGSRPLIEEPVAGVEPLWQSGYTQFHLMLGE